MRKKRIAKKGFVYLFINTSEINDGNFQAKYGCTSLSVNARLYRAERECNCNFNHVISFESKDCFESEGKIKWGLKSSDGQMLYAGTEYISIPTEDLDFVIYQFNKMR